MSAPTPTATIGPVEAFWRFRRRTVPVAVIVGVLAAALAFMVSGSTASMAIYLTDPRGSSVFSTAGTPVTELESYARQRADFAVSDDVLALVSSTLGGRPDGDALAQVVTATAGRGTSIRVECKDDDPDAAVAICAAVARVYGELTMIEAQRGSDAAVASLEETRAALVAQLTSVGLTPTSGAVEDLDVQVAQVKLRAEMFGDGVEFIDQSEVTQASKVMAMLQYGIAGFAFALLVTGALAWLAALRRPMETDPEAAAGRLGAPLLGHLTSDGTGTSTEVLATNLASVGTEGVMVITSADERWGGSDIVLGVAETWTREGRGVLLVDGNLRRPKLSSRFGSGLATVGFTDLVGGLAAHDVAVRQIPLVNGPPMRFLPCGQAVDHASSLLRSSSAETVMGGLRGRYDVVLIDASPMMDRAEGAALASIADGIVLVLPPQSPAKTLDALRRRLDVLGVSLVGVVVDGTER
jgi:Mrp family chromosome partitioning ATPase